jgi:hypothetical protein
MTGKGLTKCGFAVEPCPLKCAFGNVCFVVNKDTVGLIQARNGVIACITLYRIMLV